MAHLYNGNQTLGSPRNLDFPDGRRRGCVYFPSSSRPLSFPAGAPLCVFSCPVKLDACTVFHEVKHTVLCFELSQRLPADSAAFQPRRAHSLSSETGKCARCEGLRFVHPFRQLRIVFWARAETRTRQKYATNSVTVYHARHPDSLPIRPSSCGAQADIQPGCMRHGLDCLEHGQVDVLSRLADSHVH